MDKETINKLSRDAQERIRQIEFRLIELAEEKKEIDKRLVELDKQKEMTL